MRTARGSWDSSVAPGQWVALDAMAFATACGGSLAEVTNSGQLLRALSGPGLNSVAAVWTNAETSAIRIAVAVTAEVSETAKTTEPTSPKTTKAPSIKKNRLVTTVT
jgi:hypothetical protein